MGNLNRNVWEGWTPQMFIDEMSMEIDMIMSGQSFIKPFTSKKEMSAYLKDHQPYYKKSISEVNAHFAKKYNLKQMGID